MVAVKISAQDCTGLSQWHLGGFNRGGCARGKHAGHASAIGGGAGCACGTLAAVRRALTLQAPVQQRTAGERAGDLSSGHSPEEDAPAATGAPAAGELATIPPRRQ